LLYCARGWRCGCVCLCGCVHLLLLVGSISGNQNKFNCVLARRVRNRCMPGASSCPKTRLLIACPVLLRQSTLICESQQCLFHHMIFCKWYLSLTCQSSMGHFPHQLHVKTSLFPNRTNCPVFHVYHCVRAVWEAEQKLDLEILYDDLEKPPRLVRAKSGGLPPGLQPSPVPL